jgi:hypothetical protein
MSDPDSPAHGDYTAMTSSNSGDEIKPSHGLGVSIQQFSYDSTGHTQPANAGGMGQGVGVGVGGNDHASSSPRLPESSASHVNFHNQIGDDAEDDEGSPGGLNGLSGAGGAGIPNEEEVRLSPKEVRESSSREPSRLYGMPNSVYPVPAAPGSAIHVQPAAGPHQIAADKIESAAEPPAVVIAFINRHSGGKTGKSMAEELTKVLGADRVFDLVMDRGPAKGSATDNSLGRL